MEENIIVEVEDSKSRAEQLTEHICNTVDAIGQDMLELAQCLKTVRDERLFEQIGCKNFKEYCKTYVRVGWRQAYNYVRCYECYGEQQLVELEEQYGISKLAIMSAASEEDREELIESGKAENMTDKELREELKRRNMEIEQLTLELDEKSKEESAAEVLKQQIERLNTELEAAKAVQNQQKERADLLEKQNEELSKRPVDVAVEKPSKAEIDKIKKAAEASCRRTYEKAEKAAKKQHDKELAELREKMAAAEKANAEKLERLESENAALQRSAEHNAAIAKKTPPGTQKERVKFHVEECLRNFNAALEALNALPEEERGKPVAAMAAMVGRMKEMLS